jgi:hypothetical protein
MLLTAMSSLSIASPALLKPLAHSLILPNLPSFSTTTLSIFLVALDRLNMRNQRITYKIYQEVRNRAEEVEGDEVGTLINLAHTTARLYHRNLSQN